MRDLTNGKYPLDVETLNKGMLISTKELESIVGQTPGTIGYTFAVIALQSFIHSQTDLTCKIIKEGLAILTDEEAYKYNHDLFKQGQKRMVTRHSMATKVDENNLSPESLRLHRRNLEVQSRLLSAQYDVVKRIKSEEMKEKKIELT